MSLSPPPRWTRYPHEGQRWLLLGSLFMVEIDREYVYFWPCAQWYSLRLTERRRKNAKPSPRDVVNDRGNRSRRFSTKK